MSCTLTVSKEPFGSSVLRPSFIGAAGSAVSAVNFHESNIFSIVLFSGTYGTGELFFSDHLLHVRLSTSQLVLVPVQVYSTLDLIARRRKRVSVPLVTDKAATMFLWEAVYYFSC